MAKKAEPEKIPNPEIFEKLNDYTLSVTNDFDRNATADPELRRIFNFKARQITNVYSMWQGSVASSMHIQKFSELDSLDEVRDMHRRLCSMGGNPPGLPDVVTPVTKKADSLSL